MASLQLTVDRFEGDGKGVAVLITDDGQTFDMPRSLLPKGIKAGDVLSLTLEKDAAATKAVADATAKLQKELKQGDDGEDLKL